MKRIAMLAAVAAASGAIAVAGCGTGHTTVSAACKRAVAAQNAYVGWVRAFTTYPYDSVGEGLSILGHDTALLKAMSRAGCPGSTVISVLPS
jgi:hypothetical protein